jgi:hypothetical protein
MVVTNTPRIVILLQRRETAEQCYKQTVIHQNRVLQRNTHYMTYSLKLYTCNPLMAQLFSGPDDDWRHVIANVTTVLPFSRTCCFVVSHTYVRTYVRKYTHVRRTYFKNIAQHIAHPHYYTASMSLCHTASRSRQNAL